MKQWYTVCVILYSFQHNTCISILNSISKTLQLLLYNVFGTSRPTQNYQHFTDDIFNAFSGMKISLVQIMAWRRPGDKPLSEPLMIISLTHICVTRAQWVKAGCRPWPHNVSNDDWDHGLGKLSRIPRKLLQMFWLRFWAFNHSKFCLMDTGILVTNLRRYDDRLTFTMETPIPIRWCLPLEAQQLGRRLLLFSMVLHVPIISSNRPSLQHCEISIHNILSRFPYQSTSRVLWFD